MKKYWNLITRLCDGLLLLILGLAGPLAPAQSSKPEPASDGAATTSGARARCCITPIHREYFDAPEVIRRRLQIYQELGADMLRVEIAWGDVEQVEGRWDGALYRPFFDELKKTDFRLKLIVGTIMAPPAWFLERHPEARLVSEDGAPSVSTLSFWYPELRPALTRASTGMFDYLKREGLLDRVESIVVDFGPAGEPIYPAAWTQPGQQGEKFWCYGEHAQSDFRRAMQAKYGSIAALNAAWGTQLADWPAVEVPRPGTRPGRCWEDVLTWYRDAKREFVEWQIGNFREHAERYAAPGTSLILYVPGSDIREEQWRAAINEGAGDWAIRLMCDSRFMLEIAGRLGCRLQYTGVENRAEVEHLRASMAALGVANVPMWGENAGVYSSAKDPALLADVIVSNGLYGLDYTHSHFLFAGKGGQKAAWEQAAPARVTDPAEVILDPAMGEALKAAFARIRREARAEAAD